jgi:hypothetical protein
VNSRFESALDRTASWLTKPGDRATTTASQGRQEGKDKTIASVIAGGKKLNRHLRTDPSRLPLITNGQRVDNL